MKKSPEKKLIDRMFNMIMDSIVLASYFIYTGPDLGGELIVPGKKKK